MIESNDIEAIASILTALISIAGFVFIYIQVRYARRAIEAQTHAQIYLQAAEIQKQYLQYPRVRRLIVRKLPLPEDEETYERVMTICTMIADFYEYLLLEKEKLDASIFDAYMSSARYIFSQNPAFEKFFSVNENNYSKYLTDLHMNSNAMAG